MSFGWPFRVFRGSAAQWFARLRAGSITPGLDVKFRRWLAADPANEVEYERHELAWELAGELAGDEEIAELLADAQRAPAERPSRTRRRTFLVACSAAAAGAVVVAVGIMVYSGLRSESHLYVTAVGEQRTIVLPDRSRVVLNTATRARVIFKRDARIVDLDHGEATFSVEHDPSRPFEVKAAGGTTRALGTEFNVMTEPSGVTVSVLSGKVEVTSRDGVAKRSASQSVRLAQGQEVTYGDARLSEIRVANATRIQSWHSGRISFENLELEQALSEFNRYTETPIVLRDPSLAELRVTGLFRIGETEAFVEALDAAFGIQADHRDSAIELRSREAE
jgi:transmembrane sensor